MAIVFSKKKKKKKKKIMKTKKRVLRRKKGRKDATNSPTGILSAKISNCNAWVDRQPGAGLEPGQEAAREGAKG